MLPLLSEDQVLICDAVQRFAAEVVAPNADRWDENGRLPEEVWAGVAELGLLGAFVSEAHGGAGLGAFDVALVVEELAQADASLALLVAHHNMVALLVDRFGPPAVGRAYLSSLAAGRARGAWITSQDGLQFRPRGSEEGSEAGVHLAGTSTWVPGGTEADLIAVPTGSGRVAFVRRDDRGVACGPSAGGLGLRAAGSCQLRFEEVEVGPFGEPAGAESAQGVARMVGSTLRAAAFVGIGAHALLRARNYAQERRQFNKPIADFQAIQWKLADVATHVDASRLLVRRAASAVDDGEMREEFAAHAETYAGQSAVAAAYEAIQILGGNGFVREYGVERLLRDAQTLKTFSGPGRRIIANALLGAE